MAKTKKYMDLSLDSYTVLNLCSNFAVQHNSEKLAIVPSLDGIRSYQKV